MTDPDLVTEQYRTETRLDTRRSVWRDSADGRNPVDRAAEAIRQESPGRVLEVGCGGGQLTRQADQRTASTVQSAGA